MDMNEIKEIFFQECEEQLAELETGLLAINDGDSDPETVNAVFRAVHSIKGGAGAFALDDLVAFAHVFETTLDCVRSGQLEPSADVVKVMLKSADVLADLTYAARDGGSVDKERSDALLVDLEALARGEKPGGAPIAAAQPAPDAPDFEPVPFSFDDFDDVEPALAAERFTVTFRPRAELYAKGNEAALLLRDLAKLGEATIRCNTQELPDFDALDPEGAYLAWDIVLLTEKSEDDIRAIFEFAEWDCTFEVTSGAAETEAVPVAECEPAEAGPMTPVPFDMTAFDAIIESAPPAEAAVPAQDAFVERRQADRRAADASPTIRVDLDRVDRLINLVGELVINQAMLAQSVNESTSSDRSAINLGLEELQQLTREIQDSVMAIRAQPVKPVFQRMSRIVREIADMTSKSVRLVTEGENTEVDKTVIDKLAEPLTHMIRNAVDHGLETPEKRLAAGKPEEGTLRLAAKHRSGRIVIEIADDGAGINRQRVRQKAIDNGLISPDASLSDEEVDNLIFHPGFSTADKISDISGRGVGMDVVKRSIQQLGGRITISSTPGQGSIFTMSLPLTLAVLDGMVVTVAGQTLVVPLTAIVETLQPEASRIHRFGAGQRLISIRDMFCPLIDVGRVLSFRRDQADPAASVALLVETEGGGQRALMVDAIQGQRQVVIKSLEANYDHVPGIAAATILGDGRVALILDVDAVVAGTRGDAAKPELSLAAVG
ncbi:chemotaxis protein CheA [Pararhizobium haloflavum]|uniref:chemotaxis protein CheA n=1 Tax=Pararhizobium haloflavum TaxID=2037914 RepID=UPI000C1A1799|nr:chemotaxis protein CheA [Pararhizobium haloflavum]